MKENSSLKELEDFRFESLLMLKLRPHVNLVQLLGICSREGKPFIVTEFIALGSLHQFIRTPTGKKKIDENQLNIAKGIAAGMYHLVSENIIHRDLAARNVLLTENLTPKISDFGYSRLVLESESGSMTKSNVGPLKWMAPESMERKIYNEKTDVWSFGVTIWEMITAMDPYPELTPIQTVVQVCQNKVILEIPKSSPVLETIMALCFRFNPEKRPSFKEIYEKLEY